MKETSARRAKKKRRGGTDGQFLSCGGGDLGSFLNFRLI